MVESDSDSPLQPPQARTHSESRGKKLHDWDFAALKFIRQTQWKDLILLLKGLIENPDFLRFVAECRHSCAR
uniref:Uncharacterized protein n=1 Tax=Tanacetum cinerariifolium TaxID=118510 RepID=A0A6L2L1P6_TANCI|nr:hypothetical protein [Tanacetum cinerariifolium]